MDRAGDRDAVDPAAHDAAAVPRLPGRPAEVARDHLIVRAVEGCPRRHERPCARAARVDLHAFGVGGEERLLVSGDRDGAGDVRRGNRCGCGPTAVPRQR